MSVNNEFGICIKQKYKISTFTIILLLHISPALSLSLFQDNSKKIVIDTSIMQMVNMQKKTIEEIIEPQEVVKPKNNLKELITSENSKKEIAVKKTLIKKIKPIKKAKKIIKKEKIIEDIIKEPQEIAEQKIGDNKFNLQISGDVKYKIGSQNNPAPTYPRSAIRRQYQGIVEVCVEVLQNGYTKKAHICNSSGHKSLDYSALETIKKWKFNIQTKKTKEIYYVKVPINFTLT